MPGYSTSALYFCVSLTVRYCRLLYATVCNCTFCEPRLCIFGAHAQQALVTNYNVLTAAESEYETISTYYAPVERLCEMAIKDYEVQNGTTPANAEAEKNADGTLSIQLTDENGKVLDTYTIDPVTATGIDTDKTNVNLPQTGVTSKSTAAAVGGAFAMIVAGFWMTIRSFRRKKDEE